MWQLWSREFPFSGMNQHAVIFRVVSQALRPTISPTPEKPIDPVYKDLVTACWSADPSERPDLIDLIESLKAMVT